MADKILKELTLKIWRQKDAKSKGEFKTYKVHNISTGTSFLEMLDILNEQLVEQNEEPVAFDHDCREGICGTCNYLSIAHAPFRRRSYYNDRTLALRRFPGNQRPDRRPEGL